MVSPMKRIGDILLERRLIKPNDLQRSLGEQRATGKRLCSLLIARGLLDFDDAARALGEQKRVSCALTKHLANRDATLARLLPAELGRAVCAIAIGRRRDGELIVCARDPDQALQKALEAAVDGPVLMVIAPATRLEHLVSQAYGTSPDGEFDVDLMTGPIPSLDLDPDEDVFEIQPPMPDLDLLDPDSVRLALTDLDDSRVAKDFSQSGQFAINRTPTKPQPPPPPLSLSQAAAIAPPTVPRQQTQKFQAPPPPRPPPPPPANVFNAPTQRASSPVVVAPPTQRAPSPAIVTAPPPAAPPAPATLDEVLAGLETATSRDAATELVVEFAATQWKAVLVVAIKDAIAIGYRGHGLCAPLDSVAFPLAAPSLIQRAYAMRRRSSDVPSGELQARLTKLLGDPEAQAAAPIRVSGHVVAVLAVGDPIDPDAPVGVDAKLAAGLGAAYDRIRGR